MKLPVFSSLFYLLLPLIAGTASAQAPYYKWASGILNPISSTVIPKAIAVDAAGNVYTTGAFIGTVDFDPGPGVANSTSSSTTNYDVYISKLDANGAYVWVVTYNYASAMQIDAIATDAVGNVYATGVFGHTIDFDPGSGIANMTEVAGGDIFVLKLSTGGSYVWAKSMGGTGTDDGVGIAVDGVGNVYTTGQFGDTVDFNPGPGIAKLNCVGGLAGKFISKLDASGAYVWAKAISSTTNSIYPTGIALDAGGNVYTTGWFYGTFDFDPGAGIANRTSAGSCDIYVSKLDPSGGYIWAGLLGGTGIDQSYGITVDGSGNVYTTGIFSGTADFDPGTGTANLTTPSGLYLTFVSKLNVSGTYVWAKALGGSRGNSIAVDGGCNVYTTGRFSNSGDFDPGSGTAMLYSNGWEDLFISKLDSTGAYVWAQGTGSTGWDEGTGIAIDGSANVYSTGRFEHTVDFNPGSATNSLATQYGTAGYVLKWAECSSTSLAAATVTATLNTLPIGGNTMPIGFIGGCTDILRLRPFGASPVNGAVSSTVYILNSAPSFNGQAYVRRYYDITPATWTAAATATVTLYFTQADFTNYNATVPAYPLPAGPSDATGIANIRIAVEHGTSATGLPGSYIWSGSGPKKVVIDPANSNIIWNSTAARWEVTFDVIGFSGYFAFGGASLTPLPIHLESFSAKCINDRNALLSWRIAGGQQNDALYVIERSSDGTAFSPIGAVKPTAAAAYSLNDYQPLPGRSYYRLKLSGTDGSSDYSQIESIFIGKGSYANVYPSPAKDYIVIETSDAATGTISDMHGRMLMSIDTVQSGARISIAALAPGIYVLRLSSGYSARITKE